VAEQPATPDPLALDVHRHSSTVQIASPEDVAEFLNRMSEDQRRQVWGDVDGQTIAPAAFPRVWLTLVSVLLPLWAEDDLRIGSLAARARLSKQTMTTLVRLAERDGLVARKPDAADRRFTRVWLTERAIACAPVAGSVVDELQRSVVAAVGVRRTRALEQMLGVIMNL